MADYSNMVSASNAGKARFLKWRAKYEKHMFAPLAEDMIRLAMSQLTPEQHLQLREMDPAAYDDVMEKIGGA